MINPIYNLPDIKFVGGESQRFVFDLVTIYDSKFDAKNCDVGFAIINYANKNGKPVVVKSMETVEDNNGFFSIITVKLDPQDTLNMHGRYIYQISIRDPEGNTEIPGQGLMDILKNIHTSFIN